MSNPLERFKDTLMKKDARNTEKGSNETKPKMNLGDRLKAEKAAKKGNGVKSNLKKK